MKGEKQWQDWAQAHNDALDAQTVKANTRLPYHSTAQQPGSLAQGQWVQDTPNVRGEKQWADYSDNYSGNLDWTPRTNRNDIRIPYIGGAGLVQTEAVEEKADAAAAAAPKYEVRGEK